MLKILYISDLDDKEPIFHSQVIPHIYELKKFSEVTLMVLSRNYNTKVFNNVVFNYNSVKGDYFYYLAKINFLKHKNEIRSVIKSADFNIIYTRSIRGGLVGYFIKKYFYSNHITLLNDTRGDSLDEENSNLINKAILNHSNKIIYNNSNILFLVSNFLKEKICQDYSFNSDRAYVFPTFVPDYKFDFNKEKRKDIRKVLGFTDKDIVILYSGNLAKWQNVEIILSALKQTSNPNLKLLILTRDVKIKALINKYDLPKDIIILRNAIYEDIEKYYHAADFGILLRDNTNTNKSAAPTKFSEYVNSGLSLIINSIEADYVRVFKEKKLEGFLLNRKEDLLNCFNYINFSHIKRNVIKLNTLSELVKKQKEILNDLVLNL